MDMGDEPKITRGPTRYANGYEPSNKLPDTELNGLLENIYIGPNRKKWNWGHQREYGLRIKEGEE